MEPGSEKRRRDRGTVSPLANPERLPPAEATTPGDRVADRATALIGSWRFILALLLVLLLWIVANTMAWLRHWDPYPFIFLNLVLSFQGAFAAPVILMSQNRQEERDREAARQDHLVNLRAEREITTMLERIESLSRAYQDDVAIIRAEQQLLQTRLDRLLAALERDQAMTPEQS